VSRAALALSAALVAAGCSTTTTSVEPVPARGYPIASLCIERSRDVVVEDFLEVIERGVARHGIAARVVDPPIPLDCEYTLWYTARRRWDIRPVLGYAELRVRFRGETIGSAMYLSSPSLSPFKWRSTESKIGPLIDRLFEQFGQ
jgi:hypothetical protein